MLCVNRYAGRQDQIRNLKFSNMEDMKKCVEEAIKDNRIHWQMGLDFVRPFTQKMMLLKTKL